MQDELAILAPPPAAGTAPLRPPRIWTALTVPLAALALAIALQIVFVVVVVVPSAMRGRVMSSDEITAALYRPEFFVGYLIGSQLCFAAVVFTCAALSKEGFTRRLGWTRPAMAWWGWLAIPLGTLVPALVGGLLAWPIPDFFGQGPHISELWSSISPTTAIVHVAAIALLPGLIEESMYRGYMQQRLVRRWSAVAGIGVTSLAFALVHMDPQAMVCVLPIGLWLGIVSWRCGSVLPGAVAHALLNGAWNAFQILSHKGVVGTQAQIVIAAVVLLAAAWGFGATILLLRRTPRPGDC